MSAPPDVLRAHLATLAELTGRGSIAGIHLEGPFLAPTRAGAHDPAALAAPTPDMCRALIDASAGALRMVTLAPELPGALDAVALFREAGVVVAVGHTEADAARTRAAIDAGATVATHLYNAMPAIGKRTPGPVPVLVGDDRVTVELICDGEHVCAETLTLAVRAAGAGRVALITDAMAAAGMPDGRYRLGSLAVRVRDAVARVDDGTGAGPLAGSTLSMDRAFGFAVRDLGLGIPVAARMAATTPADALGLPDVGRIVPGAYADACLVDDDGRLIRVLSRGQWLPPWWDPPKPPASPWGTVGWRPKEAGMHE